MAWRWKGGKPLPELMMTQVHQIYYCIHLKMVIFMSVIIMWNYVELRSEPFICILSCAMTNSVCTILYSWLESWWVSGFLSADNYIGAQQTLQWTPLLCPLIRPLALLLTNESPQWHGDEVNLQVFPYLEIINQLLVSYRHDRKFYRLKLFLAAKWSTTAVGVSSGWNNIWHSSNIPTYYQGPLLLTCINFNLSMHK